MVSLPKLWHIVVQVYKARGEEIKDRSDYFRSLIILHYPQHGYCPGIEVGVQCWRIFLLPNGTKENQSEPAVLPPTVFGSGGTGRVNMVTVESHKRMYRNDAISIRK